jgi:hypothetical protein
MSHKFNDKFKIWLYEDTYQMYVCHFPLAKVNFGSHGHVLEPIKASSPFISSCRGVDLLMAKQQVPRDAVVLWKMSGNCGVSALPMI